MTEKEKSVTEQFKEMFERSEKRDSYHVGAAKFELSEQIYILMEEKGVSEAELSRRLQVSRAYINKILKGDANLTIESLVKIGRALGTEFKFAFGELAVKSKGVLDTEYIFSGMERKDPKSASIKEFAKIRRNAKPKPAI